MHYSSEWDPKVYCVELRVGSCVEPMRADQGESGFDAAARKSQF